MTEPLISVIIPVYNGEKYLDEAIESVLAQKYENLEIVVIDDGSTDGTKLIVEQYQGEAEINYFFQENQGLASARNKGISLAKGEFISFIDADDIWAANKLQIQMDVFKEEQATEMVSGTTAQFVSPEIPEEEQSKFHFHPGEIPSNQMCAILAKKETFLKYGEFDTAFHIGQDMDWILQAKEKGLEITTLPNLMFYRRLHENNMGRNRAEENYKTRFQILKQMMDQRQGKDEKSS